MKLSSKKVYANLTIRKKPSVSSQKKWNQTFPVAEDVLHEYWSEIYKMPYRTARDTKLQAFQYRVIHKTLPCNKFLSNLRICQTDSCTFCQASDSIEHFLFHCPHTKIFWGKLCTWLDREADIQLTVSVRALLFGVPAASPNAKVVNFLLIFIKFYIYIGRSFIMLALSQRYKSSES